MHEKNIVFKTIQPVSRKMIAEKSGNFETAKYCRSKNVMKRKHACNGQGLAKYGYSVFRQERLTAVE